MTCKATGKVTGETGIYAVEYMDGKLGICFPLATWLKAIGMIDQAAANLNMKVNAGYSYQAAQLWVFVSCFDWIRDFPMKDMTRICVSSSKAFSYCVKVLEASGLCVIDKTKKAANWKAKATGQTYEWYPVNIPVQAGGEKTSFEYDIRDTQFGRMFEYYARSIDDTVFIPERVEMNYEYPEGLYISPYYRLEYRFSGTTFRARMYEAYWVAMSVCNFGHDPLYSSRFYNGFHYLPRPLRKNVYFEGSRLTELFDLHCSFYTLSIGLILEKYPDTDRDALTAFYWDCVTGKLYDKCADYIGANRDIAKEKLQGWRNLHNKGVARFPKFGYNKVSEFMEHNYPVIADIYYNWETRETEKGVTVKNLQRDLSEYETRLVSKLAYEILDRYSVTCFTLHDAIYISEKEKAEKLPADIAEKILSWFKTNILSKDAQFRA